MYKINIIPPAGTHQVTQPNDATPKHPDSYSALPNERISFGMRQTSSARALSRSPSPSPSRSILEAQYHGVSVKDRFCEMVHAGTSQTEIARTLRLRLHEREELTQYMVAKEFIYQPHMASIAYASQHHKFLVSFRSAGEETLTRLGSGAAAKGHDILEKTIKKSSLNKAYGERADEVFNKLKQADLTGYVGHWDENGLVGIYVNDPNSRDGKRILPLDINKLDDVLERLHQLSPEWQKQVFTGDYDIHDMVTFTGGAGRPYSPLADSLEELRIINSINESVAKSDSQRPFKDSAHNVVRHGPQVNFVAWMKSNEAESASKGLVGSVARPGAFPVAVMNRGKWQLASNMNELLNIYKEARVHIKESWKPNGLIALLPNEGDSSGKVFLRRRSL